MYFPNGILRASLRSITRRVARSRAGLFPLRAFPITGIYRVRASGGGPKRMEGIGDHPVALALALKRPKLAYGRSYLYDNIYRVPLPVAGYPLAQAPNGHASKPLSNTITRMSRYSPKFRFFNRRTVDACQQ